MQFSFPESSTAVSIVSPSTAVSLKRNSLETVLEDILSSKAVSLNMYRCCLQGLILNQSCHKWCGFCIFSTILGSALLKVKTSNEPTL